MNKLMWPLRMVIAAIHLEKLMLYVPRMETVTQFIENKMKQLSYV